MTTNYILARKRLVFGLVGLLISIQMIGQVSEPEKKLREARKDTIKGWQKGGMVAINIGQTSLTNWSAGGENSISGNSILNLYANYRKNSLTWDNTLDLAAGFIKQGDQNRKSDDKIDFSTKLGMAASKNWYYSGLLNFRSQFLPGYNYPNDSVKISDFLAPAYIVTAIGMDYKPNKFFTSFIAPVTGKITIVNSQRLADQGAFGVDAAEYDTGNNKIKDGSRTRQEFGGYIKIAFQKDIMQNVNLSTNFDLFSNYLHNPENIDINWQMLISMKVNKYISATLSTSMIYDDDVHYKTHGPRIQFKEVLGVGFAYKFVK